MPSSASDVGVRDGVTRIAGGVNVEYEVARGVGSMIAVSEVITAVAVEPSKPGVQLTEQIVRNKTDIINKSRELMFLFINISLREKISPT